jgi:hypothetical protein
VNTHYLIFEDPKIPHEKKEVSITMLTIGHDLGLASATLIGSIVNFLIG